MKGRTGRRGDPAAAKSKRRTIAAGILALSALGFGDARGADLYAYFTRIQSGEPFERFARVGDHADVVVALGAPKGRLVFWRGSSYLPYWETSQGRWSLEEIVRREGDGDRIRPDRVNAFSHVLLVEDTPQRVTVAWRYLPRFQGGNPYRGVSATDFVEEYFAISPEGSVTRTIRRGTEKLDAWLDPSNRTVQMLQLAPDGVRELSRTAPGRSPAPAAVEGSPLRGPAPLPPALEWRFDEGTGEATKETVTGTVLEIPGHKSLWRKGVSGTCLQFDGYNTSIDFPAAQVPAVGEGITLEAWIAIGAYPWNWCPIVQQGDDDGCFLGVGAHAEAGFKIKVGDAWHEAVAPRALGLFQWRHLAGTYDARTGLLRLYLDGKPVAMKTITPGPIRSSTDPIRIGQGKPREWTDPVGGSGKAVYAFDGLIDEVRVYGRALEPEQIAASLAPFGDLPTPGSPTSALPAPDLAARALPKFDGGGRFGAHPTHLEYYDAWDALWRFGPHPDVAVTFDLLPGKFIFWRGAGYIPMLVNEREQWYSNEFNETWGRSGGSGCQEPMSDKKSLFNHVRVIENTPARVVIQWRYPLVDTQGNVIANFDPDTGWGDWSDWYYSIYPDGVAVKCMRLWTSGPRNHEWHESMAILGPGQHPEQVVATDPALILADLSGKATAYRWTDGPPRDVNFRDQKVHVVNYRAEYDPFTIGDFVGGNVYGGGAVPYSVFPTWNHWPEAQIPSDGRYASFADRAAHCSLTHVSLPDFRASHGDRPYQEKLLMEGLSPLGAGDLAPLARSWLRPPPVEALSDCRGPRYDPSQRAYVICASGASPTFRLTASPERPIVNPCFVARNWNAEEPAVVRVDPALPAGGASPHPPRQGIVRDPNGRPTLVVWLECRSTVPTTFTLRGARPEGPALDGKTMTWAQAPGPAADDVFAIAMAADTLPGIGVEYLFECLDGPGRTSGWQEEPAYTDAGLSPDSEVAYRVKARDSYASETQWSPVHRTRTRAAPAPVTWSLDEGKGTTIADASGGHEGAIHGTVEWVEGVSGKALRLDGKGHVQLMSPGDLRSDGAFTWAAWIRTTRGGTILARSGPERAWAPGGKVLFVEDGHLRFDVGWVGEMGAETPVADGRWHHVAATVSTAREGDNVRCFVDGRPGGSSRMEVAQHAEAGLPVRIGFCNDDFPREGSAFTGDIDRVQWFHYALGPEAVARLAAEDGKASR